MSNYIVIVDQGSSATKVIAFDENGYPAYKYSRPLITSRPYPGHVEQNPIHVLQETKKALEDIINKIYYDGNSVLAIGIACQRSSFILWDRINGETITPIITWQDLRAKDICKNMHDYRNMIYEKTGLPLTAHYGGPKFLWILRNDKDYAKIIRKTSTVFTPWNSFLLWHLTREHICVTDNSIAGRTLFFNIHNNNWDNELIEIFEISRSLLPDIRPTCDLFGHYEFKSKAIPILCSVGDHQGALIGLTGLEERQCAINYGTSAGVLTNIGTKPYIIHGLLTNIAYSTEKEINYTAEGTVNAVGSLFEWFEKERNLSGATRDWHNLIAKSSKGWMMIPGMYGIAAPYWIESVPTMFIGKGALPLEEVLMRAGMESIAFLITDILEKLTEIPGFKIRKITAGGGAALPPLLEFQANILGIPVFHSRVPDATSLGCFFLTGKSMGFWKNKLDIRSLIKADKKYFPTLSERKRKMLLNKWRKILINKIGYRNN